MSSHHFVKEGQEPPLVILDWNSTLEGHATQLMAWQPKVVVSESMLVKFVMSGFKPDGVIGELLGEYDFLEPIEKFNKTDVFNQFEGGTLLMNEPLDTLMDLIKEHDVTIYTDKYKVYNYEKLLFEKWLPEGKKVFHFDSDLKEMKHKEGRFFQEFKKTKNIILEEI